MKMYIVSILHIMLHSCSTGPCTAFKLTKVSFQLFPAAQLYKAITKTKFALYTCKDKLLSVGSKCLGKDCDSIILKSSYRSSILMEKIFKSQVIIILNLYYYAVGLTFCNDQNNPLGSKMGYLATDNIIRI